MIGFFRDNIDSIILLVFSPIIIWILSSFKKEIKHEIETSLVKQIKPSVTTLNRLSKGYILFNQKLIDIEKDIEIISRDIKDLENVRYEIQNARELLLLQINTINQQLKYMANFPEKKIHSK